MDVSRILKLAKEQGKSQVFLCRLLGKNDKYLRDVRLGRLRMSVCDLERIAADLGTTAEYLTGETDDATPNRGVATPVLGEVAAGIPLAEQENILGYEEITPEMAKKGEYFGLIIKGKSMEPDIKDGDRVIVRHQDFCENGQTAIVFVENEAATCKKVQFRDNGIELVSNNALFPPMFYSAEAVKQLPVTIIGVVARIIRDLA